MEKELRERIDAIKGSRVSEEEKKRLIALHRRLASRDRKFDRSSKEEKLRMLYSEYLGYAVDVGSCFAREFESGRMKDRTGGFMEGLKQRVRFELTLAFKRAGVLPLEG